MRLLKKTETGVFYLFYYFTAGKKKCFLFFIYYHIGHFAKGLKAFAFALIQKLLLLVLCQEYSLTF